MGNDVKKGDFVDEKIIRQEELFAVEGKDLQSVTHRSIAAITFLNKQKR
jgi:hypothetical protein